MLKLNSAAEIFYGKKRAFTHLAVAAHPDDIEIMCGGAIAECYDDDNKGLVAVVVSDGGGSPRNGEYASFTYAQMVAERKKEQRRAAEKGRYAALIMLGCTSREINEGIIDLASVIASITDGFAPYAVYTHNPADKHPTHIGVLRHAVAGFRKAVHKPEKFYGCECWRDLDWLDDSDKTVFDMSENGGLIIELLNEHRSQVAGGKRYDLALEGRWRANATFLRAHSADNLSLASYAVDMLPLLENPGLSPKEFISSKIEAFKNSLL